MAFSDAVFLRVRSAGWPYVLIGRLGYVDAYVSARATAGVTSLRAGELKTLGPS